MSPRLALIVVGVMLWSFAGPAHADPGTAITDVRVDGEGWKTVTLRGKRGLDHFSFARTYAPGGALSLKDSRLISSDGTKQRSFKVYGDGKQINYKSQSLESPSGVATELEHHVGSGVSTRVTWAEGREQKSIEHRYAEKDSSGMQRELLATVEKTASPNGTTREVQRKPGDEDVSNTTTWKLGGTKLTYTRVVDGAGRVNSITRESWSPRGTHRRVTTSQGGSVVRYSSWKLGSAEMFIMSMKRSGQPAQVWRNSRAGVMKLSALSKHK